MTKNKHNKVQLKAIWQTVFVLLGVYFCPSNFAQDEILSAPLPGGLTNETAIKTSEIIPQSTLISNDADKEKTVLLIGSGTEKFPVSINGLRTLVDKYKQEASQTNFDPETFDPILVWVDGLIRAHNRLANAFAKQSNLKSAYEKEGCLIRQLRGIKNEILYIKAQSLIKEKKLKQAIPLLVDITCSEPNSILGLKAYQHLTQSGFSGEGNLSLAKQTNDIKANK